MSLDYALECAGKATNVVYATFGGRFPSMNQYPSLRPDFEDRYFMLFSTVREMRMLEREYRRTGCLNTAQMLVNVEQAVDAMLDNQP